MEWFPESFPVLWWESVARVPPFEAGTTTEEDSLTDLRAEEETLLRGWRSGNSMSLITENRNFFLGIEIFFENLYPDLRESLLMILVLLPAAPAAPPPPSLFLIFTGEAEEEDGRKRPPAEEVLGPAASFPGGVRGGAASSSSPRQFRYRLWK